MRSIRGIGMAVLVASLLAGASAASAQTIRVGFHAPLTGFAASDGKSALNGAELALEQINGAGGVQGRKLEFVVHDDQAKADQAVPLANKYIGEGLKIVISGSYSAPTRAAAGVFDGPRSRTSPHTRSTRTSRARASTCSGPRSWARFRGEPRPSSSVRA